MTIEANDHIFRDKTGLSILEIRILRLVDDNPGITFVELNKLAHLERSKTSRLIQSLVKAGLLERVNDSCDARRFALYCTAAGSALRNRARSLADGLENILFQAFTAEQRSAFEAQLGGLLDWVHSNAYSDALADWEKSCDGH
ncbi:MarR family winged helix-turn-helix transcriptional regulator [Phaeovulum sp. NW3]|nr:MarR family winged helix-turn-helix transcriptional regulator [Phaeovulum sp. NW3]